MVFNGRAYIPWNTKPDLHTLPTSWGARYCADSEWRELRTPTGLHVGLRKRFRHMEHLDITQEIIYGDPPYLG